jgi:hypothetical protein
MTKRSSITVRNMSMEMNILVQSREIDVGEHRSFGK